MMLVVKSNHLCTYSLAIIITHRSEWNSSRFASTVASQIDAAEEMPNVIA